jgi:hypothetical protein
MTPRLLTILSLILPLALVSACVPEDPPTITAAPPDASQPIAPGQSVEITMPPPVSQVVPTVLPLPVRIDQRQRYVDADRAFSIDVPLGWTETRQDIAAGANDVQLGTVFAPAESNALLSITHFNNGQRPSSLGVTTNQVLKLTGWTELQDYQELRRENVIQREGEALRVDVTYTRNNGVPMHSLVLFQIDGTNFSMVNLGVERGSYLENESAIRQILDSYRVPGMGEPSSAPAVGQEDEAAEEAAPAEGDAEATEDGAQGESDA